MEQVVEKFNRDAANDDSTWIMAVFPTGIASVSS